MNSLTKTNTKVSLYVFLAVALICIAAFLPITASAALAADIAVDDDWVGTAPTTAVTYNGTGYIFGTNAFATIQDGVDAALIGNVVGVADGTYDITTTILINQDITLDGETQVGAIIRAGADLRSMIRFGDEDSSVAGLNTIALSNLTIDGNGYSVKNGVFANGGFSLDSVTITDISATTIDVDMPDIGLYLMDSSSILNLTMTDIGRYGIFIWEAVANGEILVSIDGFDYTGKGSGSFLDFGIDVAAGAVVSVTNSSITNCAGVIGTTASAAIFGSTNNGTGTQITVTNSTLTLNQVNIMTGHTAADATSVTVNDCTLVPTIGGLNIDSYSTLDTDFTENYWNEKSAVTIASTFATPGTAGAIDFIPYYMTLGGALSDAFLEDLAFSAGVLTAPFVQDTITYTLNVPYEVDAITVTPTLIDDVGSIVTVNGTLVTSGTASSDINLNEGSNTITVFVDGTSADTTYTITAYRYHSDRLDTLAVSDASGPLALIPAPFDPDVTAYDVIVDGTNNTVDIAATAEDAIGSATVSGDAGAFLALNAAPAETAFTITCTSQDAVDKNYVVTVKYISDNPKLDDIKVNGTTLVGFDSNITTYSKTVANAINAAVFDVTKQNSYADYTINGAAPLATYPLAEGANAFVFLVTAQDGTTTETYTVNITRESLAASTNANLSALTVDGVSVPAFDENTLSYVVAVDASAVQVTIGATKQDAGASVSGTGVKALSSPGLTTLLSVQVTAEDGVTTKTYVLTIVKSTPGEAKLATITVDGIEVDGFDTDTFAYAVSKGGNTATVTLAAVPTDAGATISGLGVVALNYGANPYTITVTASGGGSSTDYMVTITRTGANDAQLDDLKVDGVLVTGFDPTKYSYTVFVADTTNSVTISATPKIDDASVLGTGVFAITHTETVQNVVVTAQDGVTTLTYRVNIVKSDANSTYLKDLTLDGTTVDDFVYNNYEYVLQLPSTTASVTLGGTPVSGTATVLGTGTKNLDSGGNDFTVTVRAADASAEKDYDLTLFRGFTKDATLQTITISGSVISGFSPTDTSYYVTVPYSTNGITLLAETNDDYASVSGIGWKNLSVGTNTFTLTCTADDDTTKKTYTVKITRKAYVSSSGSSSSSSTTDDEDDKDDEETKDDENVVVFGPGTTIDVIEDILLKDTEKIMDGKMVKMFVDDDAFQEAILNVISKKNIEEGDGSTGITARPFISLPKANSVDDEQSVGVGLDAKILNSAFRQGIGFILTLDNYTMVIQPNTFSAVLESGEAEDYFITKKLLKDSDNEEKLMMLGDLTKAIYLAEVNISYVTTEDATGIVDMLQENVNVSIMLDNTVATEIEEAESITEIKFFVEDNKLGTLMAEIFQYDKNTRVLQLSTKNLGMFIITKNKKIQATPVPTPEEKVIEQTQASSGKFPPILMIIIAVAIILLAAIIVLVVRRAKGGLPNNEDGGNINI